MRWLYLSLAVLSGGAAQAAFAADGLAEGAEPVAAAQGVTSYPAAFFAANRPNTAADMVERIPGFTLDRGQQVRGYEGASGNVIIDGQRPTSKQDDLETILRRIPAGQVERIDVIRGGAPGIDMHGQTVVANVILKKNGGTTYVVSPVFDYLPDDGRFMPSARLEMSRRSNGRTLEASFSFFNYWDDGTGDGPHRQYNPGFCPPPSSICTGDLHAKAGGQQSITTAAYEFPLGGGRLRLNGIVTSDNYRDREHDENGVPAAFDDVTYNANDTYRGEFGAHYGKDLSPTLSLELVALQQVQRHVSLSNYWQGSFYHFREGDTLGESILRGVLHWTPVKSLSLEGSIEGAYNIQTTETRYLVDSVAYKLGSADVRVIERRTEAQGTATWSPSPKYTLEVGLKVEASNLTSSGDTVLDKTLIYPKPRVVFTWSPDPSDQLRLRFAREVGQLDFNAFISTAVLNTPGKAQLGNVNLVPQDVWVGEVAVERKFWKAADLTLTARHLDISQAVDRILDPSGAFDEPGNIGHAHEDDLIADLTAPLDKLYVKNGLLKLKGTWRHTAVVDPTTFGQRSLTKIHPLDWSMDFTQDLAALKSTWGVSINGRWRERYFRYDEIDTYKLGNQVQVSYEYKPTAKLAIRLELNNITDRPLKITYNVYDTLRPSPLVYSDWRSMNSGPEIHLRFRRTFN